MVSYSHRDQNDRSSLRLTNSIGRVELEAKPGGTAVDVAWWMRNLHENGSDPLDASRVWPGFWNLRRGSDPRLDRFAPEIPRFL